MTKYKVYGYVSGLELGINDCAYYCKEASSFNTLKEAKEWKMKFLSENRYGAVDVYKKYTDGSKPTQKVAVV